LTLGHGFEQVADTVAARFPAAALGARRLIDRMAHVQNLLNRLAAAGERRSLGALLTSMRGLIPVAADWRLSLAEALSRDLGNAEGVKCALAGNLPYYHDDPRSMWWLHFAVAQGGYLGAGSVYIRGGSAALSGALARSVSQDGGDVLPGRVASRIEIGADGSPVAMHHTDRDGKAAVRVETGAVLANAAPQAVAAMLPEAERLRLDAAYAGRAPSISLFSACFGLKVPPREFGLKPYSSVWLPDWMTRLDDYAEAGGLLAGMPGRRLPPLTVVNYSAIDARLDADGPSLVTVVGIDRVANWAGLTREASAARREAWLDAISAELERRHPGMAGAVTTRFLLSARSMRDYLGTPDGAIYGFAPTPPRRSVLAGLPHSPSTPIPGLFLASSFGGVGGFSGAMRAGADAARLAENMLARR